MGLREREYLNEGRWVKIGPWGFAIEDLVVVKRAGLHKNNSWIGHLFPGHVTRLMKGKVHVGDPESRRSSDQERVSIEATKGGNSYIIRSLSSGKAELIEAKYLEVIPASDEKWYKVGAARWTDRDYKLYGQKPSPGQITKTGKRRY